MPNPKRMAQLIMENRYVNRLLLPITFPMTSNDATLTAGPAMSSTSAVPGDKPFSIRATAIGIEPVAHKYIGIANNNTINILERGIKRLQS